MAGNIIGTTSYSEAMDLSDLDDCGYEQESIEDTPSPVPQQPQQAPIKIRKKPGRKPNPASPALRKAQNRAAQRAFRERKERHMKDLETNIRGIREHRDKLLQENQTLSTDNEILKAENWYLKGIVLSLQLVCLQHNLVIPQHCPHVDEKTLGILNQSIPQSIASYINVNSKNKLQISTRLMNDSPEISNIRLQQEQHKQRMQQNNRVPTGSILITPDGIHRVSDNRNAYPQPQQQQQQQHQQKQHQQQNWYPNHPNPTNVQQEQAPSTEDPNLFAGIPPLSPMSTADTEQAPTSHPTQEIPPPPVMLSNEPITSNLAAIQTLRLRLRLQSACVRMQSIPFAIQPTLLQLTIPHDPRIDLIPTPHMRDRMILYRDQFDLDDCFRCLLSGSVFHGGDPALAGNWQLPAEFFEKYWFLTIDYNLRRCTNEWRKLQGLEEIHTTAEQSLPDPPVITTQPPPPPQQAGLSYEDLSGYLGVQLTPNKSNPQEKQTAAASAEVTPIQLMNGYGVMNHNKPTHTTTPATNPWQSIMMGQKKYDLMMTGMYNNEESNSKKPH